MISLRRIYQRSLVWIGWDFDQEKYDRLDREAFIEAFSQFEGTSHSGGSHVHMRTRS